MKWVRFAKKLFSRSPPPSKNLAFWEVSRQSTISRQGHGLRQGTDCVRARLQSCRNAEAKKRLQPLRFFPPACTCLLLFRSPPPARFSQSLYRFPRRLGSPSGAPESRARRQPGEGKAALDQPRKGRKKEALNLPNALRPDCPLRKFRGQQNSSEDSESTEGTESAEGTESTESTDYSESPSLLI